MRRIWIWAMVTAAAVAAQPAGAAVDLLQRLEERGIITAQERQELAKQEDVTASHRGSFSWATEDGRFRAQLYGYGQVRYTFEDRDERDNVSNFSVQRARVGVRGHVLTKALRYQLYLNVYSGNEADVSLFDWFADYVPTSAFGIKAGAYKVPYGIQWTTSATGLQFVERTAVDAAFRFDRDTGVTVHGKLFSLLSYDVGVYNGEGKNRNNPDDKHLYVGRLRLEPLGKYSSHESDNERSARPAVLVATGVAFDDDVAAHTRSNLNGRLQALGPSDVLSWDGFVGAKWMGASLQSEYHHRWIDPNDEAADDEEARGFYVQGGYFVWGDTVEVAARYEFLDPRTNATDDLRREYGMGVNYFFAGHRNKLQADFFRVATQQGAAETREDNRFRLQYQLAF